MERDIRFTASPTGIVVLLAMAALLAVLSLGVARAQAVPPSDRDVARAGEFLSMLDRGEYGRAHALLAPAIGTQLTAAKMQELWTSLPAQAGAAGKRGAPRHELLGQQPYVAIAMPYAQAELEARLSFDAQGRIIGFWVTPATPSTGSTP